VASKVWAQQTGSIGLKGHFKKVGWKLDLTMREALENLDGYANNIEELIQEKEAGI
jgi:hypothetical protein